MDMSRTSRSLLVRTMAANAFLLSAIYLGVGLLLEGLRRLVDWTWVAVVLRALDGLPARTLQLLGLLGPLRDAYLAGEVREGAVRAIFAVTTLGVILTTAAVVGVAMYLAGLAFGRRAER